jgi:hypothetical protein
VNNKERLLSAIFGQPEIKCYPYIWQEKEDGESEIRLGTASYPVRKVILDEEVQDILGTLGDRHEQIVSLYFGLKDGKCLTQKEIAKEYKVTHTRIGQIIHRSLVRLRHPTRSRRLKEFIIPSPEERFKEKQKILNLEKELERQTSVLYDREDERRLAAALKKASDDYQREHSLTISPYNRIHNALRRQNLLQLSQLRKTPEQNIRSFRSVGKESFEVIKRALLIAEQEAPP